MCWLKHKLWHNFPAVVDPQLSAIVRRKSEVRPFNIPWPTPQTAPHHTSSGGWQKAPEQNCKTTNLLQLKLQAKTPGTKCNLQKINVQKQTDSNTLICFELPVGLPNYLANTIHSLHYIALLLVCLFFCPDSCASYWHPSHHCSGSGCQ